jgi:post-segregation antitoxin (ccd killing protein)
VSSTLYDHSARKRTVSLTVNSDLLEKARTARLNVSRVAAEALAAALLAIQREEPRREITIDMDAPADYVEAHGNPAAELRAMYGGDDAA